MRPVVGSGKLAWVRRQPFRMPNINMNVPGIMRKAIAHLLTLFLHPEAISIKETRRAIGELSKLGIQNYRLIINGIIPLKLYKTTFLQHELEMQEKYIREIEADLPYPNNA